MTEQNTTADQLALYLYKSKLSGVSLVDILPQLSENTIACVYKDLHTCTQKIHNCTPNEDEIYIFTDGGCKNNGKHNAQAGYAVFVTDDKNSSLYTFNHVQRVQQEPTNQKAELLAILHSFTLINNIPHETVVICTDSMYSIKCVTEWCKNWSKPGVNWTTSKGEKVKHADIIKSILMLKTEAETKHNKIIKFKHILSHCPEPTEKNTLKYKLWYGNKRVDEMINELLRQN